MLGDLYLIIKKLLRQTFCDHKYSRYSVIRDKAYKPCGKCNRVKKLTASDHLEIMTSQKYKKAMRDRYLFIDENFYQEGRTIVMENRVINKLN